MRAATTSSVVALVIAALVIAPREATAQPGKGRTPKAAAAPLDPEAAEDAKLRAGIDAYEARDPKRAIGELERLYASTKKPRALYWLGRAHQDAGEHANAIRAFKRYLREGGGAVSEKRSVEVLGHVQTLTMQVGAVTVTAPAGATIKVDGVDAGEAPLAEPIYLDPGKHTLAANGTTKTVDVVEETRLAVDLRGAPEPAPAAAAAPTPAPASAPAREPTPAPSTKSSNGSNGVVTVAGLGLATVLAGGSVFFAVKAAGTSSDFDAKKSEAGVTRNDLEDLQGQARMQSGVALGLGVAALATAGLTLFVFRKSDSRIVTTGNGIAVKGGF